MSPLDRFILLTSLSIFFFAGAFSLARINLREDDTPKSVIVSPTAAEMITRDPKPKVGQLIKLCYSEEKYTSNIQNGRNAKNLLAKGFVDDLPIEIYANNVLGYGGTFSVYRWEPLPDGEIEVCRILHGRNLEMLTDVKRIKLEKVQEDTVPELDGENDIPAPDTDVTEEEEAEDIEPILRKGSTKLKHIPNSNAP